MTTRRSDSLHGPPGLDSLHGPPGLDSSSGLDSPPGLIGRVVGVQIAGEGGVPKRSVESAELTAHGVVGDRQLDREHHGGPTRAVCLYAQECIDALAAEGHPISRGTTGENLTLAGLDWPTRGAGDRLTIADVVLEITGPAPPCTTIAASFQDGRFVRISDKVHPGWSRLYARVLVPGRVHAGAPVQREPPARGP